MPAATAAQMREADRRCIQELGIPGVVLMDHAGKAVFDAVDGARVGIVCGRGNNGGDGFVVGRYAKAAGRNVSLVLLARPEEVTGDALVFMKAFHNCGGTVRSVTTAEEVQGAMAELGECDVLVDALLGTGLSGEVRGICRDAIDAWPARYTVAVDIPSGLHADTGEPLGAAIRAEHTVTFQRLKTGFLNPAALAYTGQIIVADIGIPDCCFAEHFTPPPPMRGLT